MTQGRRLGEILLESGRISAADIGRALEHVQARGGRIGQALVALDLLSPNELVWALAEQFGLPYVFPDPATVDPSAADLVPAEWALANLAVPLHRSGNALAVAVSDPTRTDVVAELRRRTGLSVELALAPPARILEVARALYGGRAREDQVTDSTAVSLGDFIAQALCADVDRFGLSIRGARASGWHPGGVGPDWERAVRCRLAEGWERELGALVRPAPGEEGVPTGTFARWEAVLLPDAGRVDVKVEALNGGHGSEVVFHLRLPAAPGRAWPPHELALPSATATELRLLARSRTARVALIGRDLPLARSVLPYLPAAVLGESNRSVHFTDQPVEDEMLYVLSPAPGDPALEMAAAFAFDAVTVDLPADDYPVARLLEAAPFTVACLREPDRQERLAGLGIRWILHVRDDTGGKLVWDLQAALP